MPFTFTQAIAAPPEKVFHLVDDPEQLKRWLEGVEETTYLAPRNDENPVGTRFKQKIREGGRIQEYDGEVIAYDRPRRLAVRIWNSAFTIQVDYRFAPEGSGTRLDYQAEFVNSSFFMRVMVVLVGWYTRRLLRRQMAKLKELAETGS
jgi:uncharacterized protein YndB with AHSA1/START domain